MFKKIITFIKYNTFVAVVVAIAFVAVASAVASNEEIKKQVLGEEIKEKSGIDNYVLLTTDLDNFNLEMKITDVTEDEENYYIDYQFNTLEIKDNVWKNVFNQSQLVVSIEALEERDLGLYVAEELGEIIDYQLVYLKEVQESEKEKGETFVQETTKYTGLIGLVLDTKTKELSGYEPVIKTQVPEASEETELPIENPAFDENSESDSDDYSADDYYYKWLIDDCLSNSGYWYNDTCNVEPKIISDPSDIPVSEEEELPIEIPASDDSSICDIDNLDLCDTEDLCEEADLYWYNNVCNELQDDLAQDVEPIEDDVEQGFNEDEGDQEDFQLQDDGDAKPAEEPAEEKLTDDESQDNIDEELISDESVTEE